MLVCGDGRFFVIYLVWMPRTNIFGLMMSEFVLIDQLLLWGVRYGFLFEIDRTLIWWFVL